MAKSAGKFKVSNVAGGKDLMKTIVGDTSDPEVVSKNFYFIYPKYREYRTNIVKFLKMMNILFKNFAVIYSDVELQKTFLEEMMAMFDKYFDQKYFLDPKYDGLSSEMEFSLLKLSNDFYREFGENYQALKGSDMLSHIMQCGSRIITYHNVISQDTFNYEALVALPMIKPYDALEFDFVYVAKNLSEESQRTLLVLTLKKLHDVCEVIYTLRKKSDVDPIVLRQILIMMISQVKTRIPGCDDAFRVLENSIDTFEKNFDNYYENYAMSNNPGLLFEDYIQDLQKQNYKDPKLLSQFYKIISEYKKQIHRAPTKIVNGVNMSDTFKGFMDIIDEGMKTASVSTETASAE